jgi:uncharacterized Zn finger protein (UPF0148 family)
MLTVNCPHCQQPLAVPEQYAGKVGRCNQCGQSFTVPTAPRGATPVPTANEKSNRATTAPWEKEQESREAYWEQWGSEEKQKRAQGEAEHARRAAQWRDVAQTVSCTATDRQVCFLLDLGVSPKRLQGITERQASELIDELLQRNS